VATIAFADLTVKWLAAALLKVTLVAPVNPYPDDLAWLMATLPDDAEQRVVYGDVGAGYEQDTLSSRDQVTDGRPKQSGLPGAGRSPHQP